MTVRRVRGATMGVAAAFVAGLVLVPVGGASGAGDSGESGFQRVSADLVGSGDAAGLARATAGRTASEVGADSARAAVSKAIQILQVWTGVQGVGQNGVSVAAGPKHVVQATGPRITGSLKSTGATPKGGSKTLLQFFGLSTPVLISQPVVVYDPVGKRFIAAAVADNSGDVGLLMRISKGTAATPLTGKKWLAPVEFAFATSAEEEPDRTDVEESKPLLGVSSDKIVVTTVANDPDDASIANRIFIFPKAPYYAGNEPGGWAASVNSTYDGQAPAVNATKQPNAFVAIPDTGDVTVTTYTGAAKSKAPSFSKNTVFPSTTLTPPTPVAQTGGDTLDLGGLAFTGVAWRSNKLFAAATVLDGGRNAVRVFGINTASGVSLASDKTLESASADWFTPDVAVDGAGNVLVTANDVGTVDGPSLAVFARKGSTWLAPRFVAKATDVVDAAGGTTDWWNATAAASDPSSPWDVWVSGAVGASAVNDGLTTKVARVSLAKNKATIKASSTRVKKGGKVTFTLKLTRPDGKDVIKGLPLALQRAPKNGGAWSTVKSVKTGAKGTAKVTVKVKKAAQYRALGKKVSQQNGEGRAIDKVASKAVTVRLR